MPLRPGISDATLERLGIRHVTAMEGKTLTGLEKSGIYIPFKGVNCAGSPFGRLRLDDPIGDMKYHQRKGTKVHNYVQENLTLHNGDLIVIEGEFKSISLTEAGFPAVGTAGFYSWGKMIKIIQGLPLEDRDETDIVKYRDTATLVLHREIQQLITKLSPNRVVFVGDPNAVLNLSFGDAMGKFAALLPCPLAIARIPYDAPDGKGVDDIREAMGQEAFAVWFQQTLAAATLTLVPRVTAPEFIIGLLIERERLTFAGLVGERREMAKAQLAKLFSSIRKKRNTEAATLAKSLEELARNTFQFPLEDLN